MIKKHRQMSLVLPQTSAGSWNNFCIYHIQKPLFRHSSDLSDCIFQGHIRFSVEIKSCPNTNRKSCFFRDSCAKKIHPALSTLKNLTCIIKERINYVSRLYDNIREHLRKDKDAHLNLVIFGKNGLFPLIMCIF